MAKRSPDEIRVCTDHAERGDVHAQMYLGWAYVEGKHIEKNDDLAIEWLGRAAKQGSKEAMYRLAMLLLARGNDEGITRLNDELLHDFPPALYELGNCYYTGALVERDKDKAEQKWTQASEMGHAIARIKLFKYQSSIASCSKKPLYMYRAFRALLTAIAILIKNENDPRVLGSFR